MIDKLKLFIKVIEKFGVYSAIELTLLDLGLRKQHVFSYPITPMTLKINKGPLAFWRLLEKGNWEIDVIRFIVDLVKPGETIFDVGAWIGPLALLFSHLTGKNGTIYAFEPMPVSFSLLEENIADNNVHNIHSYNKAISNRVNYITLYSPSQTSLRATTLRPHWFTKIERKCECTTIDQFCKSQNIEPDGIKIDVEGAEGNVLEGAIKTIQKRNPWCLLEFHGRLIPRFERQRIWSFLRDRAKKILYVQGDEKDLTYKMEVPHNFQPTKRSNYCIFF